MALSIHFRTEIFDDSFFSIESYLKWPFLLLRFKVWFTLIVLLSTGKGYLTVNSFWKYYILLNILPTRKFLITTMVMKNSRLFSTDVIQGMPPPPLLTVGALDAANWRPHFFRFCTFFKCWSEYFRDHSQILCNGLAFTVIAFIYGWKKTDRK